MVRGEAVEDEAGGAVGLVEPLEHHPGHQRVGRQVAAAQVRPGGLPQRGGLLGVPPQQRPHVDRRQPQPPRDTSGLRPLPGPRGAD
jgi:hypothetical protein